MTFRPFLGTVLAYCQTLPIIGPCLRNSPGLHNFVSKMSDKDSKKERKFEVWVNIIFNLFITHQVHRPWLARSLVWMCCLDKCAHLARQRSLLRMNPKIAILDHHFPFSFRRMTGSVYRCLNWMQMPIWSYQRWPTSSCLALVRCQGP